ncbi:YczI family protein [Peribacillus frigoritolerans]|uniref:YczI family protein n=1 Tax=Peribacillus frigoritolerans TaxID=450367 RepID=UPI0020BD5752|nr:YczI family protein [Peribacillus frigoritolerans]MEB2630684.1 YczI family protein [Peribacillus frigoritolerans]
MVRIILAIVVIVLSGYSLIAQTLELMPYYMFFLGALILVIGLAELQKDRKVWGYMNIVISLFVFFASIQDFLMN